MQTALDRLEDTLTSKHWVFRYYAANDCPATLLDALRRNLPHLNGQSWRGRLDFGGIYLNGAEMREDAPLPIPCCIEYYEPKFEIADSHKMFARFSTDQIVFEDSDLIAVFKPAKLPCGQSREQRHFYLRKFVEDYVGKPVHMPSRLDTSAQGLVLFSKSKRMHRVLQQTFEKHQAEKYYVLQVSPPVTWKKLVVRGRIGNDPNHTILRRVVEHGGLPALTHFTQLRKILETDLPEGSLLLAKPQTGRTHQLRVHCASIGHPIIGDNFYGGVAAPELRLLALRFKFHNPLVKQMIEISLPERLLPAWVPVELVIRKEHSASDTQS